VWALRVLVKRRHTHVGAPDNRIEALYKEYVLTPRGRDMNPVLGPVVTASPKNRLSYLSGCGNRIFYWSGKAEIYDGIPRLW
jgi:hypothetical protein